MTTTLPVSGKVSATKVALIFLFLLGIWAVFSALPARKEAAKIIPFRESPLAAKLQAVGLPDNPDLGALPEIFAIWADKAQWKDGKTRFAYWHPVMKTYTYFFEATRSDTGIHFREISEPNDPAYHWDDSLSDDCPIRFYFFVPPAMSTSGNQSRPASVLKGGLSSSPQVEVTPLNILSPAIEPIPIYTQPKR